MIFKDASNECVRGVGGCSDAGCCNVLQDDRDASWMRRPSLLAAVGGEGHSGDGDGEDLSSPPSTWEDRADGAFETSNAWMDSGELLCSCVHILLSHTEDVLGLLG